MGKPLSCLLIIFPLIHYSYWNKMTTSCLLYTCLNVLDLRHSASTQIVRRVRIQRKTEFPCLLSRLRYQGNSDQYSVWQLHYIGNCSLQQQAIDRNLPLNAQVTPQSFIQLPKLYLILLYIGPIISAGSGG